LYLRRGDQRRRIYLKNGALVLATSTVPGERLGDALLSQNVCPAPVLRQLAEQTKGSGKSVLELLQRDGIITPTQHGEILARLTEQILYNAQGWIQGEWQLVPGRLPPEVARPNQADQPLWSAMLTSYEDWRKVHGTLADVQTCLVLTPDALKQPGYKELGFAAKQLLSHFSRERSVHQIARGRILNRFEELLTLARCVELGLLKVTRLSRPEEARPAEAAEAESTLPLQRGAVAAVDPVSAILREELPPPSKPAVPSVPQDAQALEDLIKRRQKAAELRQIAAEQNKVGGDINKALEFLQQAIQLDPESVELPIAAAEILLRNPRRLDDAALYCRKALALQPENGRAHVLLGKLFIMLRDLDSARKELELARGTTEDAEAERILATLTRQVTPRRPEVPPQAVHVAASRRPGGMPVAGRKPTRPASGARKFLVSVVAATLLLVWAYGMYRFIWWRVDASFGPPPAATAMETDQP
jgi:tetratricopeptide (TPR) repeat protein